MDLSFQGQKTEHVYLFRIKFYCKVNTKKFKKRRAVKKSTPAVQTVTISSFLQWHTYQFKLVEIRRKKCP
jgi:hypothetical protein